MTVPLSRSLSPRAWAIVVWLSAILSNVNVSGLVVLFEQQLLAARGVSAKVLGDLEHSPLTTEPRWLILNATVVQLSLMLCAALWLWLLRPQASLPLKWVPWRMWLGTFMLSLGALPIGGTIEELVRHGLGVKLTTGVVIAKLAHQSSPLEFLALILSVAVLPGLAEETLFRGIITRQLLTYSKLEALLLTSTLFGLAHIEPAQAAGTFVLGLAFGYARIATGSLLPAIAAHILNNTLVLSLAFLSSVDPTQESSIEWPILSVGAALVLGGVTLLRRSPEAT